MPYVIVPSLSRRLQNCKVGRRAAKAGGVKWLLGLLAVSTLLRAAPAPGSRPPEKPPLQHAMMGVANGCFVETVAFLDRWHEAQGEAWARLLQWGAREDEELVIGHAVAVCEARGVLWCWDINRGWARVPVDVARRDEAEVVAAPILRQYPKVSARFPTYRFDFPQAPSSAPPVARLTETNSSVRDASIVGAQLAKRRPVNVVRFSYGPEEARRESAAAVFVFHGRYCIYVPEHGTVPFRTRGDVGNLRLIQELLRRGLPGVTGLRRL